MNQASALPISVVIACHTQLRWDQTVAAVQSVAAQTLQPAATVVTVDHEPHLFERLVERFPDINVVENEFQPGASGNRNTGVAATSTPLIAFLDDDARARPDWLANLIQPFGDQLVVGTGGYVVPSWSTQRPRWFPGEFDWVVGASHLGLPTEQSTVRNVWSENMAVRRDAFDAVGGFRLDFCKVGSNSRQEDTDLCIRMGKSKDGAIWKFVPSAIVDHHVGKERMTPKYFLKRCYLEGRGKIELARNNEGHQDLPNEREYFRTVIPVGIRRNIRESVGTRDIDGLYRSGAMLGGIAAAGIGALASLSLGPSGPSDPSEKDTLE